jgi:methionyl-tRNA formyltransferase
LLRAALRVVFFGTPEFAVPTLERLLEGPHRVVGVVSQPDRPRGRGRRVEPSPVSRVALRAGLPLLRPESMADPRLESALRELEPDLGVVVAFGHFLPRRLRELPRLAYLVNGHASLLPRWRGAAPIARAILAGDRRTGISVMRVEREMDAGPVALRAELEIDPDEDAGSLEARLAALCADAIARALDEIAAGRVAFAEQDHSAATFAPKLEPGEARLDWSEPAEALARRVRALAPSPGAWTGLGGQRLRILAARAEPGPASDPPGTLRRAAAGERRPSLRIATGAGWLLPTRVQRAGGRAMETDAFLRGFDLADGTRLGEAPGPQIPGGRGA